MWEQEVGARGRLVILPCDYQTAFVFWYVPESLHFARGTGSGDFFLYVLSSETGEERDKQVEGCGNGAVVSIPVSHGSCYVRVPAGRRIKAVLYSRQGRVAYPCLVSNTVIMPRCLTATGAEEAVAYSSLRKQQLAGR